MTECECRRGFTLVELLVVVLIIGILAAVAVPQYQKAVEKTRLSEALAQLKLLERATDVWIIENEGYPASKVNFLGSSPDAYLPFSVGGKATGTTVKTDFFTYTTYCLADGCDHIADRTSTYRLFQRKTPNGNYVRQCEVRNNESKIAHFVCDEMQKQGWPKVIK